MEKGRLRRISAKQIKLKVLDDLWSRVVRQRAGNKCENCGSESRLQGAHIFSKGKYRNVRHLPENGLCLCWRCHLGPGGIHKEPMDWYPRVCKILLEKGISPDGLRFKARTSSRPDNAAIKIALERELEAR